nr:g-type lectin s-receptor-like serine/threonine-protein kinase lecrk2 [Quercus suber]
MSSIILYGSFKEPTDTILPGQILYMDTALRSRQSDTNYSDGRFRLSLQLDGNLVLYSLTKSLSSEPLQKAYFATGTLNWESKLNFAEDGYMYIKDANESNRVHNLITNEYPGSKEDFYYLARIVHDGGFRPYRHFKKDTTNDESVSCSSSSSWTVVKSIPDDICSVLSGDTIGGGFCGPNSICSTFEGSRGTAFC